MSESMPYFAIAWDYRVPYADVLAFVEQRERGAVFTKSELPSPVLVLILQAMHREHDRRARVIAEDRKHEERKRADFEEASEPPGCAGFDDPEEGDF